MAEFTIEFARGELPGPTYEDYSVGVTSICGDDARTHPIKFNDTVTGDYIVGYNWSNPSYGLPPGTIRIEGFTDVTEVEEIVTGTQIPVSYPPNTLKDLSTGLDLTYPYITPISNLPNIVENFNQTEITCYESGSSDYRNTRIRTIEYVLADTGGNWGPLRSVEYRNIAP